MWFYPAAPPDYFFVCQDCKYTQRFSGLEIGRAVWNFRSCRSCQSTNLPHTVPVARSAGDGGIQMAETAPAFLLQSAHPTVDTPETAPQDVDARQQNWLGSGDGAGLSASDDNGNQASSLPSLAEASLRTPSRAPARAIPR